MEYIISSFSCFLDLIFHYLFWDAFMQRRGSRKQQTIFFLCGWLVGCLLITFSHNTYVRHLLVYLYLYLLSLLLFQVPWYQRLVLTTLGYGLQIMTESAILYGATALLQLSYTDFIWRKLQYTVTLFSEKFLALFLVWILWSIRKKRGREVPDKRWVFLSLLYPLTSLHAIFIVFYSYQDKPDLSISVFLFSLILIGANIATLYLIKIMERRTVQAQENALLHKQMEIQTESITALEKNYRAQRQFVHNFKNQLQTVHDLLSQNQTAEAMEYIENLQGMQTTRIFAINSHHPIIDAVLNHKYQVAKEHNIDCQVHVNDLSSIQLSTDVLVVILSNLMDNAIEACCRLPNNRAMECKILAKKSIFLSIRNTSPAVTILGDTIPTTKFPKENHGYGLPAVQHLLQELHAEFTFIYQDGWFQFVAEIPMSQ